MPRPSATIRRTALSLSFLSAAACYQYGPVQTSELGDGTSVRLRLSGTAVDRLRASNDGRSGLLDDFSITGTVSRASVDSLQVEVPTTVMEANVRPRTVFTRVAVARSEVQYAELRQLNRRKTTWAGIGLGVAAVASVAIALDVAGRSGGLDGPPGSPPDNRLPAFIRLSFR
ncbi:MAG: hypothetical protein ACT4OZ_16770 [Gemmatimonadota bacterium]